VLEHLANLASATMRLFPSVKPMQRVLMDKHFFRKHGPGAYYGQARGSTGPKPKLKSP
jgi:L-ribulose-5-phosphate 4-epimerase